MPYFIRDTFIYKMYYNFIVVPFNNSLSRDFLLFLRGILRESKSYSIVSNYINRKPYFIYSKGQKLFRKITSFCDKIADFLNEKLGRVIKQSKTYKTFTNVNNSSSSKKLSVFAICFLSIILGYSIGIAILSKNISTITCLTILNVSIAIICSNIEYIKDSLVFKICKSLYKLVKM